MLTVGETAGESFHEYVLCCKNVRSCSTSTGIRIKIRNSSKNSLWEKSQKQYDAFSPGPNEWPALLRRCDTVDPSYKE